MLITSALRLQIYKIITAQMKLQMAVCRNNSSVDSLKHHWRYTYTALVCEQKKKGTFNPLNKSLVFHAAKKTDG